MPTAYEGKKPYIFVSYSHKDTEVVMQVIEAMQKNGIRVWYDGGIEAGSEWPEYIASHLKNCSCMLSFISENFIKSPNCRRELNFGQDLQKDILNVYIDNAELTDGMKMQLGLNQAVFKKNYKNISDFCNAICAARIVQQCRSETAPQPEVPCEEVSSASLKSHSSAAKEPVDEPSAQPEALKPHFQWTPSLLLLCVMPLRLMMQYLFFNYNPHLWWPIDGAILGLTCTSIVITVWRKDKAFLGIWLVVSGISVLIKLVLTGLGVGFAYVLYDSTLTSLAFGTIVAFFAAFIAKICFAKNTDKTVLMAMSASVASFAYSVVWFVLSYGYSFGPSVAQIAFVAVAAFAGVYLFKKLKCFE